MTNDDLRRYRDCARELAELADPFIKPRLLALALRYEDRIKGQADLTKMANLPGHHVPKLERTVLPRSGA